jgi:transcriptional regulator with XRE-family HTH domain
MATGKQILFHRKRLGLTLVQLSEASGVEIGTISALENRDSSKSKYFPQLAAAMGLTVEQLTDMVPTHGGQPLPSPAQDENKAKLLLLEQRKAEYDALTDDEQTIIKAFRLFGQEGREIWLSTARERIQKLADIDVDRSKQA